MTAPGSVLTRWFFPRVRVSRTNIFARMVSPGVQALAYGMNLRTRREVAMVLPLPVARDAGEDAVRFVDLSATPQMFRELDEMFALPSRRQTLGVPRRRLAVHHIGSFVASYVPASTDFDRLDPRFRLPAVLFDALPRYADHGFAVFQLAPGAVTVHPMGLTFATREPARLFFPTVHLHDGRFHATAKFDHSLYYQQSGRTDRSEQIVRRGPAEAVSWRRPARSYGDLVDTELAMLRQLRTGRLPNDDTWLPARP